MNAENSYTPAKTILLTGAGFTKTFGGYLASEMWHARTVCRFRYFIRLFADSEDPLTRGFVFTLNQELFLERYYSPNNSDHRTIMRIPGVTIDPSLWFSSSAEPPDKFQVKLPKFKRLSGV